MTSPSQHNLRFIRTLARILGTASLIFLCFIFGAHIIDDLSGVESFGNFNSNAEVLGFIGFPVMTIIGLVVAWKWEGIGGSIALLGLILLFIALGSGALVGLILLLISPSLLYITYWYLAKKSHREV